MSLKEKRTYGSCGENTEEVLNVERSGWMACGRQRRAEEKSSEAGDDVYMKACTGWAQAPLQFHP